MKFCHNCGKQIDENAIFCPRCGARVNVRGAKSSGTNGYGGYNPYGNPYGGNPYGGAYPVYDTTPSKLVTVISFLFWQVGLILWLVWRNTRPGKAQSALNGTLASACVGMPVLGLVIWLLWKNDPTKRNIAKIAGISAIVGASVVAFYLGLSYLMTFLGLGDITLPMEGLLMFVTSNIR
jgi:hypothetical protein